MELFVLYFSFKMYMPGKEFKKMANKLCLMGLIGIDYFLEY